MNANVIREDVLFESKCFYKYFNFIHVFVKKIWEKYLKYTFADPPVLTNVIVLLHFPL